MKKKKLTVPTFLLVLFSVLLMAVSVTAAPKYQNEWVKTNARFYHYNEKGKKDKGLTEINGKTYYFDNKYIQRIGWQKIDGKYYFFDIMNAKKGYMLTSTTVNGITLTKKGYAKYNSTTVRKLEAMVKANKIVEGVTNCEMKKPERLLRAYDELMSWQKKYVGSFQKNMSDWDVYYANLMFDRKAGDCYPFGCAFAYLANAVGYTDVYAVSSGGHGWSEVNGKVYDPSWDYSNGKRHKYYNLDPKTYRGWPNYRASRKYFIKI